MKVSAFDCARIGPAFLEEEREALPAAAFAQEYLAEFTDEVEGALWSAETLDATRVVEAPTPYRHVVVGLDPSDGTAHGDEQGLAVVAQAADGEVYVLESSGHRMTPYAFLQHACDVASRYLPNRVTLIAEKNHGGKFLTDLLEQVFAERGERLAYRTVSASQGKITRAEPVAGAWERGIAHLVGSFPELEIQLTSFTGAPGERSPDRLDALVWACSHLLGTPGPRFRVRVPRRHPKAENTAPETEVADDPEPEGPHRRRAYLPGDPRDP